MGKTKILSFLFVVLFVSDYANDNFFFHTHIIDGVTIVHSHIHTDLHHDSKSGGHISNSVFMMHYVDYLSFYCDYFSAPTQLQIQQNKFVETTHWVVSIYFQNLSLRAPPIV